MTDQTITNIRRQIVQHSSAMLAFYLVGAFVNYDWFWFMHIQDVMSRVGTVLFAIIFLLMGYILTHLGNLC